MHPVTKALFDMYSGEMKKWDEHAKDIEENLLPKLTGPDLEHWKNVAHEQKLRAAYWRDLAEKEELRAMKK
jgi:hypothetical protein